MPEEHESSKPNRFLFNQGYQNESFRKDWHKAMRLDYSCEIEFTTLAWKWFESLVH